uniref:Uncharacterized protein n=2 Tax=Caenorhabditis japonica TaxID=281687 RepID=A0A8R1IGZ8_CAEJA
MFRSSHRSETEMIIVSFVENCTSTPTSQDSREVCDAIRPVPNGFPLLDTSPLCKLVNDVLLRQWKLDTTVWDSSESSPV